MLGKKVSIIIPAYNEEKAIQKTVESLKNQKYDPKEIIVVVNGSEDRTFEIAESCADKVLNFPEPIGPSAARNEGAKIAGGEVFIFSDADTQFSDGAIEKISKLVNENILGACLGKGDNESIKGKLFFFFKNWSHRLGFYKGTIDGVLFCHRDLFFKINGFDKTKRIAEFVDFIKRALMVGGKYKLLTNCYAITSLRRYEEKGYLKGIFFWIGWKIKSFFKKDKELEKKYFEIKK